MDKRSLLTAQEKRILRILECLCGMCRFYKKFLQKTYPAFRPKTKTAVRQTKPVTSEIIFAKVTYLTSCINSIK